MVEKIPPPKDDQQESETHASSDGQLAVDVDGATETTVASNGGIDVSLLEDEDVTMTESGRLSNKILKEMQISEVPLPLRDLYQYLTDPATPPVYTVVFEKIVRLELTPNEPVNFRQIDKKIPVNNRLLAQQLVILWDRFTQSQYAVSKVRIDFWLMDNLTIKGHPIEFLDGQERLFNEVVSQALEAFKHHPNFQKWLNRTQVQNFSPDLPHVPFITALADFQRVLKEIGTDAINENLPKETGEHLLEIFNSFSRAKKLEIFWFKQRRKIFQQFEPEKVKDYEFQKYRTFSDELHTTYGIVSGAVVDVYLHLLLKI